MSDRFTTWWAFAAPAGQHAASPGWSRWGAILLDHGRLSRKHIQELVLLFVPVPVGGARRRLQRMHVAPNWVNPPLSERCSQSEAPYICASSSSA